MKRKIIWTSIFQETFIYDEKDLNFVLNDANDVSEFDKILQNLWDAKMNEGDIFWYKLNITEERTINGVFFLQVSFEISKSNFRMDR